MSWLDEVFDFAVRVLLFYVAWLALELLWPWVWSWLGA